MKKLLNLLYLLPFAFFVLYQSYATTGTYTRAVSGQTATASYVNNGWDFLRDADNSILDGDDYTGNNRMLSGTDWLFCEDASCATVNSRINGDTGQILGGLTYQGLVNNCDIAISAGTMTIHGKSGVALAATNPCYIAVRSDSTGYTDLAKFTSNVTATYGATSQTDSNLFGIDDANWTQPMPLMLGVVDSGTQNIFTLSRVPLQVTGSAATDVCQLAETDCDDQNDVMLLSTGLTLANFTAKPITQVGWITGTYATTGGAWTLALRTDSGFNKTYNAVRFTMESSQFGAGSGRYIVSAGGAPAAFVVSDYTYSVDEDGNWASYIYLTGDGGTDGAGSGSALVTVPFKNPRSVPIMGGPVFLQNATESWPAWAFLYNGQNYFIIQKQGDTGGALQSTNSTVDHDLFVNGDRDIQTTVRGKIF